MDNYEVLEVIHASKTSETIILKVKEKNKKICEIGRASCRERV